MALGDVGRLEAWSAEDARAFVGRLREVGVVTENVARAHALSRHPIDAVKRGVIRWHLRRASEPWTIAARLLLYGDAVTDADAARALGEDRAREAEQVGLLVRGESGQLRAAYAFGMVDDLVVLYDDLLAGGDAVMGLGPTTSDLCRAAYPDEPVDRALDLGCGAGTIALLLASRARGVVGTDINPRAVRLARVNAKLNGVANAEFREGDMFAPVAGERFDRVVSQPPFISQPPGADGVTWMHGGARGDELPRRCLRELGAHLAPGGRAFVLVEWPMAKGDPPIERRVREELGETGIDALVLAAPAVRVDDWCAAYVSAEKTSLAAFDAAFAARRDHLDALGVQALCMSLVVLARADPPRATPWTQTLELRRLGSVRAARVERVLADRDLLEDRERLLATKLRVRAGARFSEPDAAGAVTVTLPEEALVVPIVMPAKALALVRAIDEAPDLGTALRAFAEQRGTTFDVAFDLVRNAVRGAVVSQLLERVES